MAARPVHDQLVAVDAHHAAVELERREPAGRRTQDDLAVREPLRGRDHVHREPVERLGRLLA